MPCTKVKLTKTWQKIVNAGSNFSLQVGDGQAELTFEFTDPSVEAPGFILLEGDGVNQDYGTGNTYVRGKGYVVVMT